MGLDYLKVKAIARCFAKVDVFFINRGIISQFTVFILIFLS